MTFKTLDLYVLPRHGLEPFDLMLFNGIFYHAPHTVAGLKIAGELTHDLELSSVLESLQGLP
jgi:hypothetical protein